MSKIYTIAKINNFYFALPSEDDQDYYDDCNLSDLLNPASDIFKHAQLTADISKAYPFNYYETDIKLPRYALFNDTTFDHAPTDRHSLKRHFKTIYKTENVLILDVEAHTIYTIMSST